MSLSPEERRRYSRHLLLEGFGENAQLKLQAAKVLVIGAGGLGTPLLQYLSAAGVGTIGIVEYDTIDLSNLQRQVLFSTNDTGQPKLSAAVSKIKSLNPLINVIEHPVRLDAKNAMDIFRGYDLIADGSDNFATRYLVNDAAVLLGKPLVYGSVFRFEGQVTVFNLPDAAGEPGPNYRDLFPTPPAPGTVPGCSEAGVLGVLPGIIGNMQALEVIKIIAGIGEPLSGRLFHFDALSMQSHTYTLKRNPANIANSTGSLLRDYDDYCGTIKVREITPAEFASMQAAGEPFELVDVREKEEYDLRNLGGRLIPLSTILDHAAELPTDRKVILHCKSGARSARAIRLLEQQNGFTNLYNLSGGIDAIH